jgi:hypothetical protein
MTVIDWLLDADPSIRWQVMRGLTHEPADVVAAERSKVATKGGARLLALQAPDGQLVDRLLAEQLPDGGWNCEVENGATVSSFGTTMARARLVREGRHVNVDPISLRQPAVR